MTVRLIKRGLLAAAAMTLLFAPPARTQTGNGHYASFPLTIDFFDECSGEEIVGQGQVSIASSFKANPSGGFLLTLQFRSDFTAVGLTTGAKYVEHDAANESINVNGNNPQFNDSFVQSYHVNTSG